jgi:hypothetical protein
MTRKSKVSIIKETVKYYKTHDRAKRNGSCVYYDLLTTNRCAVGRCIPLSRVVRFSTTDDSCYGVLGLDNLEELLGYKYRGHDVDFWDDLQVLHDSDEYWNKYKRGKGHYLTSLGKDAVKELIEKYS